MAEEIGSIIKQHRLRLKLTQQEIQKRTGINSGNLSKIERGQQSVTNNTLKLLAEAFGMSVADLFSAQRAQQDILGKNGGAGDPGAKKTYRHASEFETIDQILQEENVAIGTISASVDAARGGMKITIDERHSHVFSGGELQGITSKPAALGAYLIEDDMMEPRLYKGDTVLVDTLDTDVPVTGGVFCVILDDENISFCRLLPYPGKGLRITYDNPKYPEAVLDYRQASTLSEAASRRSVAIRDSSPHWNLREERPASPGFFTSEDVLFKQKTTCEPPLFCLLYRIRCREPAGHSQVSERWYCRNNRFSFSGAS
jgi:transcriptional regulator with XRE-family HTH domain